ncbi:HAMP domain-containing methyl-accepting chemotaxis protein [Stutzerimonas kirkiae]|uniref:Methyl-accepting chemotaxis protein n=1 Tax=Stutzerimonas kirkiae TaxID=2211392 RepID=A0A4Q9RC41_9GAMM|nr:methyl-accepting chemotaxis protein [Stutzerimonas kirkiae]TBU98638.1 methyl-accepting chemotaxis protein [Stutzerimonas kirkiae]TBV00266.1 methyl-accepting chemotaxis protein [Stutzerimonas kirkiae]TBV06097.1 methyl-accepting chemotaxis protein [Stutzerimonas kirkiae]TBV14253.1 methyl-accepting chemotaxis protein [Stutzerimonas kirkiae]
MFRLFDDLNAGIKLAVGFGLVLLLTIGISLVGTFSTGGLIERGDKLQAIQELNEASKDLRIARLNYTQSPTGQNQEVVGKLLDFLQQKENELSSRLSDRSELELLSRFEQHLKDYRETFERLVATRHSRDQVHQSFLRNAADATQAVLRIEDSIGRQPEGDARTLQLLAVSRFSSTYVQARLQTLNYILREDASLLASSRAAVEQAGAAAAALDTSDGAGQQALKGAIDSYIADFDRFQADTESLQRERQDLFDHIEKILGITQALQQSQLGKRDSEASSAYLLLNASALVALFIGILAAVVISRRITQPLQQTLTAVGHIAAGDLTRDLLTSRKDEIGRLQQGVQNMTQSLRELIGHISDSTTQIASAAEQLSAVTEQTSAGVNSQKVETDQVATAMNEMAATVHEVARNAEDASNIARQADQDAQQGERVVRKAVEQMNHLAEEVEQSASTILQLKQESDKIGGVLDVIKAVAEQTNLLALNAAIEAARAGEAGRGFAVVADEVRGLAQRTQKSTEEIEELIASLQGGTQQSATLMEKNRELTHETAELAREAGRALESITHSVSSIQSMNQQIATAAEEQSAVAEEINRSVINVRDISEQSAAASEETAASSVELARLGTDLQQVIGRFRI